MNVKGLTALLVFLIIFTTFFAASSLYVINEMFQASHKTTLSLEEELNLIDEMIGMAKKNEIKQSDFIRPKKINELPHINLWILYKT